MTAEFSHDQSRRIPWRLLAIGLIAATLLPIGIHTVMLDDLGIPYPDAFPRTGWAAFPDHALRVLALFFLEAALRADGRPGKAARLLILVLVTAALNEDLLRLPIMRNAVSTKWTIYPFVDNLPQVLRYGVLGVLVAIVGPLIAGPAARIGAAVAIAAIVDVAVSPALGQAFARLIASNAAREGDQLYTVPYDWHVDLPSYLTYAEPALAALFLAWLLARGRRSPLAIAAILFGLRAGPLFGIVLNVVYARSSAVLAMLSKGQFALESAALSVIAAVVATRAAARFKSTL